MEKGSRGGLEFLGRLLGAAREKGELSRGPRESHLEHQYSAIKSCSGRADEKGGTEKDRKAQVSSVFFLSFNFLCPLLSEASLAGSSRPGLVHFKALPGWRELFPGKRC